MLLTLMSSAAVAHGDVAATSTSETTAPLPLVVKLPVLDRSGRVVTLQKRNIGKRRSSSACVQELGICSIRNIWPRPASTFHLDLIHFWRIWSKDIGNNTIVSASEPPALPTTTHRSQRSPYSARALLINNRYRLPAKFYIILWMSMWAAAVGMFVMAFLLSPTDRKAPAI
jgi:hypothetical protein